MRSRNSSPGLIAVVLLSLILLSGNALAASTSDQRYNAFTLYGWFPSLSGELKYDLGDDESGSVDAGDILDALKMVFMGSFETHGDKWLFIADVIYLDLGKDNTSSIELPIIGQLNTRVDLELKGWQVGLYGGYNVYDMTKASLDIIAGLRYLTIDTEAKLDIDGTLPPALSSATLSSSGDVWNGIVGLRGRARINERWFFPFHADVGAGGSDLTWQAMAGIGYKASWGETSLVYRHLEWDQGDDDLIKKLSFSGPAVAFKFLF